MATELKNAFSTPSAATDTLIYTCPVGKKALISEVNICNKSNTPTTYRVYVKSLGVTDFYKYYDAPIGSYGTFLRNSGDVMVAGDELYVRATLATVDFCISLQENS